jgi:hypothetical protein
VLAALVGPLALGACNTPQIPITPSDTPTELVVATDLGNGEFSFAGNFTGSMSVGPGDRMFFFDQADSQGLITVVTAADMVQTGPLPAKAGDTIEVWYYDVDFSPPEESPHDCVALAAGMLPAGSTCP